MLEIVCKNIISALVVQVILIILILLVQIYQ